MIVRTLIVVVLGLLLGACQQAPLVGDPQFPYGRGEGAPQLGENLHIATGYKLSDQQMLDLVDDARIAYVGEVHDNPEAHRLQEQVLAHLIEQTGGQVALAMEMFTPAQQVILDRWTRGKLTEREFLKQVAWYDNWKMDFRLYRGLLTLARQHKVPVLGVNAEKPLIRQLARKEIADLDEATRAKLPEMDFTDPLYLQMIDGMFAGHEVTETRKAGFKRVQTLWDETMASNIAAYLQSPAGRGRKLVVVAGGGHVRYGYGIPRRVFRRLPVSYVTLGTEAIVVAESKQDQYMDVDLPTFPMRPYDILRFVKYEELPPLGVKLGALIEDTDQGVRLGMHLPRSVAATAGLQKGDLVRRFNQETIEDTFDLLHALRQLQPGSEADIEIQRDGTPHTIRLKFPLEQETGQH